MTDQRGVADAMMTGTMIEMTMIGQTVIDTMTIAAEIIDRPTVTNTTETRMTIVMMMITEMIDDTTLTGIKGIITMVQKMETTIRDDLTMKRIADQVGVEGTNTGIVTTIEINTGPTITTGF